MGVIRQIEYRIEIFRCSRINTDNFTNMAEARAKDRPGYTNERVEMIIELAPTDAVFADIGAGKGKLMKVLVKQGFAVYVVEPNKDRRK